MLHTINSTIQNKYIYTTPNEQNLICFFIIIDLSSYTFIYLCVYHFDAVFIIIHLCACVVIEEEEEFSKENIDEPKKKKEELFFFFLKK